jgi:hypothetical protein
MDFYESVRVKALRDVFKGDSPDYILRRIYRWYSTTFHVPLPEVDDISLDSILQHYFEHYFETLSGDKRLKEVKKLFEDEDIKKIDAEAAEDEEFIKNLKIDLEKEKKNKELNEVKKKDLFEKSKNQNIIHKLGNSPAASALKRFIETEDALSGRKK